MAIRKSALVAGVLAVLAVATVFARLVHSGPDRLLAIDADSTPADKNLAELARAIAQPAFHTRCAGCHGDDLAGDRTRGIPNLATARWLYGFGEVSEIERTITYGIRSGRPKHWDQASMPAFGTASPYRKYKIEPLRPDEIRDAVEYVESLAGQAVNREAAARGHVIYLGRGLCFDCHGEDGRGDPAIGAPGLTGEAWLYGTGSRDDLFASVAHGHAGVCPGWSGEPDAATVRALAVYLYLKTHKT